MTTAIKQTASRPLPRSARRLTIDFVVQTILWICLGYTLTGGALLIKRSSFLFFSAHRDMFQISLWGCLAFGVAIGWLRFRWMPTTFHELYPVKLLEQMAAHPRFTLAVLFLTYALCHIATLCFMHLGIATALWDLGFNDNIIWNAAHGRGLTMSVWGGQNILGAHFFMFLGVLAPIYRVFNHPTALFVAQSFCVASTIPLVYAIVKKVTESRPWAIAFSLAVFFYAPMSNGILFPFHSETFADPLILAGFLLTLINRRVSALVFFMLALACKENMAVYVSGIGVFLISKKNRFGFAVVATSLAFAILHVIFLKIYPCDFGASKWGYFDQFLSSGKNPLASMGSLLFTHQNLRFLFLTMIPFALLPLASFFSNFWLLAFPYAFHFLSSYDGLKLIKAHYTVGLNAIIFIAATYGLAKIKTALQRFPQTRLKSTEIFWTGLFLLNVLAWHGTPLLFRMETALWEASFETNQRIVKILESIPPQYSIVSTESFLAHVSHRPYIFSYTSAKSGSPYEPIAKNPDLLLLDTIRANSSELSLVESNVRKGYHRIFKTGHLEIYARSMPPTTIPPELTDQWAEYATSPKTPYRNIARQTYKILLISILVIWALNFLRQLYACKSPPRPEELRPH